MIPSLYEQNRYLYFYTLSLYISISYDKQLILTSPSDNYLDYLALSHIIRLHCEILVYLKTAVVKTTTVPRYYSN